MISLLALPLEVTLIDLGGSSYHVFDASTTSDEIKRLHSVATRDG